ncbi:MAG: DUF2147 domain-containing protein [Bacteroidales bacterium]|jgi:hypothetical protein|nr:DUF2147 domain-containing protein [Bacteroidales bacterium]
MKKLINTSAVIIILLVLTAFEPNNDSADKIIGKWILPDNINIEIYKENNKYFGKIIDISGFNNGQTKDVKNSDKNRQNDKLLGKIIISNLEYDSKQKKWVRGTIYAPQKGIELNLKINYAKDNELEAEASKLFFWKSIIWGKL